MAYIEGQTNKMMQPQPSVDVTQEPQHYILSAHLPGFGFKKEAFKVEVNNYEKIIVRSTRPLGQGQSGRVEQIFDVPKDSDITKITSKFENDFLHLTIPKKTALQQELSDQKTLEVTRKQDEPTSSEKKEEMLQRTLPEERQEVVQKQKPAAEKKPTFDEYTKENIELKKVSILKQRIKEIERWFDLVLNDTLDYIDEKKNCIGVALIAFSTGYFFSQKVRK